MKALLSAEAGRLFNGPLTSNRFEPAIRAIPAIVYLLLIFTLSGVPGKDIQLVISDKIGHFTEYFILGALLMFAAAGMSRATARHLIGCWLFAVLYAASDEFHQSFVPNRDSSALDWTADAFGAAAALILIFLAVRQFRAAE